MVTLWNLVALNSLLAAPTDAPTHEPARVRYDSTATEPRAIAINRAWDVLADPSRGTSHHLQLARAAELLGAWTIDFAGVEVRDTDLLALARTAPDESLVRAVRERLRRAVDLEDFLLFLDDLLKAGEDGLWGQPVCVTPGRARAAGILLHPDDVFRANAPRIYAKGLSQLNVDPPEDPSLLQPAPDHSPPAPEWTARYPNPEEESQMMVELAAARPHATFARRLRSLFKQLRQQGADVAVDSTIRRRERGYLMWGAFMLSRQTDQNGVREAIGKLDRLNHKWGLNIPIAWAHPKGWRATIEASRTMADAYAVVYATRRGARHSSHYDGTAIDFTVVGLPRKLRLVGADSARATFDLSAPHESRDLSLTPRLIDWIEIHFKMKKLRPDYPHWSDAS